jgi:tryptophan-rich sensory protein
MADVIALLGFLALCVAAASSGALFKPGEWHASLAKPRWHPPNWAFGPAWAVFYTLIAVSGWLVWRVDGFGTPILIWLASLGLNAAWSWLFFGLRRMDLAFVEVLALWLSVLATIVAFAPVHTVAALLLLPYLAWVAFAATLNYTVWRMNLARA